VRPVSTSSRGRTVRAYRGPRGDVEAGAAAVAAASPAWYAANRATIGADPSLIRPGQVLTAPAGLAAQGGSR